MERGETLDPGEGLNSRDFGLKVPMRKILACAVLSLAAVQCFAGVSFVAKTRSDAGGDVRVRAWVSGSRAKVVFLESQNGGYASGDYMVSPDEGKTMYLVSPATRTYTKYDVQSMMTGMAGLIEGIHGVMKVSLEAPRVEKLLEEDGGLIAGLPTRHYRYRTSYTATMNMLGSRKITNTIEEDIWATDKLVDPALGVWLKKQPLSTGDAELDKMIRIEMDKVKGFPLKRVTVSHEVNSSGAQQTTRSEMEVTEVKQMAIPLSQFRIPADYKEVVPKRELDKDDD